MYSRRLVSSTHLVARHRANLCTAKKIPIEHILASTRGAGGRGAAGGRPGAAQAGGVDLEGDAAKGKDACNC